MAASVDDLLHPEMLDRCFGVKDEPGSVVGERQVIVGGSESVWPCEETNGAVQFMHSISSTLESVVMWKRYPHRVEE